MNVEYRKNEIEDELTVIRQTLESLPTHAIGWREGLSKRFAGLIAERDSLTEDGWRDFMEGA